MLFKRQKYRSFSDDQLAQLIADNADMFALGIIYDRYGHLVFGLALKYMKNQQDAEEITSRVFESLQRKIASSPIKYFKSWLYTISKNECLMELRKKTPFTSDVTDLIEDETDNLYLDKEIRLELLESAIAKLKDEQRKCVEQFYLESKSYQQISDELEMPLTQVKSAIQNGKRNLKLLLEQHNEFK